MTKQEIEKKLGATDGENGASWDTEILSAAVESCMRGESAWKFEGRPDRLDEMERFAKAWRDCQNS